jgi:hypothetical protein
MRDSIYLLLAFGLFTFGAHAQGVSDDPLLLERGDANSDGVVNLTDAMVINSYLYSGGPAPPCMNQADANDDGVVDGSDAIYLCNWLFCGGMAPPYPGPYNTVCAIDPLPRPGCLVSPCD